MAQEIDFIGKEIREFIKQSIDSIATLEILLLYRKKSEKEWTVHEVATEVRSSTTAIKVRSLELHKRGLLKIGNTESSFQYAPASGDLDRLIDKLAKLYTQYPIRIIDEIYNPQRKAIQDFADAFKIKKEGEDG